MDAGEQQSVAERRLELAERRLADARADARSLAQQNQKLNETLREARGHLVTLKEQLDAMATPPCAFGVVVDRAEDALLDVQSAGRHLRVAVSPEVDEALLVPGTQVLLNEALVVVAATGRRDVGELAALKEVLAGGDRALITGQGDDEQVVRLTAELAAQPLKVGDSLLVDRRALVAFERIPRQDVEELVLEEVPDVDYADIGGLGTQIEQIRDAVELPFLHRDLFARYQLSAPKGVLLYGPPGCGKTMIAKAVAKSLATSVNAETGGTGRSYFLNIKGPELLNKYVGETERQIRVIFQRARERATSGMPVIVFFDEMDSLFRTRGSGVSSDVENTIVPQLLSEIDGVEGLANVMIIGASNREDMIDPAILRPGRLDVKIKLDRPDAAAAREIFGKYLTPQVPLRDPSSLDSMINDTVAFMYAQSDENRFLEVTYASGEREVLYFKDFSSGAMIQNVVGRAKKLAIKDVLERGLEGVTHDHLRQACLAEFAENEDLPNTTNPDDWARISGKKGERIVFIRTLVGHGAGAARSIET